MGIEPISLAWQATILPLNYYPENNVCVIGTHGTKMYVCFQNKTYLSTIFKNHTTPYWTWTSTLKRVDSKSTASTYSAKGA
jgi:hypothetical protein